MPWGKKLIITNPNGGRNLESIKVDGNESKGYFISHDLLKNGAKIEVQTKK
jgi:hypothetical protein